MATLMQHVNRLLAAIVFGVLATTVSAQDTQTLKRAAISGWQVLKLQTPKDGLSCQAVKCNTSKCDVDTAEATIRFWGSQNRQAITPMIGTRLTVKGARNATVTIADATFPLTQAQNSRGKLFIAKNASDDQKIMQLVAANPKTTITFRSDQAIATFRLNGIPRVLSFFARECAIPKP